MPYPELEQVRLDFKAVKTALRATGVPAKLIKSIETKALKTGRKVTGEHATNRQSRWAINPGRPQYASESDARIIFIILCAMMFEFDNAPDLTDEARMLFESYLEKTITAGAYKDALLLEKLDYHKLRDDALAPQHGYGVYHIATKTRREHPGICPTTSHDERPAAT